ncbi:Crp/Fnr family transcriptional regulator [Paraflavitalea pollutisoli]|uniref:Crp/Fnr family transcriptional regulator n=1 Tax=Paraflavitalea pollutisoli TaxID=3034143 RepID=UPI0023EA89DF|nr:cyclic nucleotide-binding domain-containing protein [Paraflavitalea sp. H1-2-19X]
MRSLRSYASNVEAAKKTEFVFHLPQLSRRAQKFLRERSYPLIVKKREILIKQGEVTDCFFYLRNGALREYITADKIQYTTMLIGETNTTPNFMDFYFCQPTNCTLQAAADSIVDVIHLNDIYDLFTGSYKGNETVQSFATLMRAKYIDQSVLLRWHVKRRYKYFAEHYGDLINMVPHKYIACYLGMASETFSRLHNRHPMPINPL